jgi:hypothetical protein
MARLAAGHVSQTKHGVHIVKYMMKAFFAFALVAASEPGAAAQSVDSIASRFQGEWNANIADCGTGDNDSVLEIQANRISYWESEGLVKAVVVRGQYQLALIVEFTGEGETWLSTAQFELSPDQDKLISKYPSGDFVRFRCPREKK